MLTFIGGLRTMFTQRSVNRRKAKARRPRQSRLCSFEALEPKWMCAADAADHAFASYNGVRGVDWNCDGIITDAEYANQHQEVGAHLNDPFNDGQETSTNENDVTNLADPGPPLLFIDSAEVLEGASCGFGSMLRKP